MAKTLAIASLLVLMLLVGVAGPAYQTFIRPLRLPPSVPQPPWWRWAAADRPAAADDRRDQSHSMRGLAWRVVDHLSTPGILMVTVETHRMGDTLAIAQELVEPLVTSYGEVLVYFRSPHVETPAKRVQWLAGTGFIEMNLSPAQPPDVAAPHATGGRFLISKGS